MKHLDLFSGIGGAARAVDEVWDEVEHIFVEKDDFCQQVLRKHFPDSPIYGDINDFVQGLTGMSTEEYNEVNGISTEQQVRERFPDVFAGDVNTGDSRLFSDNPTGDVEDIEATGSKVQTKYTDRETKSVLPGDESERSGAEPVGASSKERSRDTKNGVRELRSNGDVQKWPDEDTSAPPRLQQAIGCDVVVPEMPPRMAQNKQSDTSKINGTSTNTNIERRVHGKSEKFTAEGHNEALRKSIASLEPPFLLTGGFPCPSFSQAGKRKGTADPRYLWPQMCAIIAATKPRWVVAENVRGLTTWERGLALEIVCTNLEELGYSVQPFIIPAVAVNAPHRRDRVWIVANNKNSRREGSDDNQRGLPESIGNEVGNLQDGLRSGENRKEDNFVAPISDERPEGNGRGSSQSQPLGQPQGEPTDSSALLKYAQQEEAGWSELAEGENEMESNNLCEQSKDMAGAIQHGAGSENGLRASEGKIQSEHNASNAGQQRGSKGNEQGMEADKTQRTTRTENIERCSENDANAISEGLEGNGKGREASTGWSGFSRGTERTERFNWNDDWVEVASAFCVLDDELSKRLVRLPDGRKISYSKWRQEALKGLGNAWVPAVAVEIFKGIKQVEK